MKMINFLLLSLTFTLISCASKSTQDYGNYLNKNKGKAQLTKRNIGTGYYLTENTVAHSKKITSWTTGIGNSWEIKFQEVVDATLKSDDYTKALGKLEKHTSESKKGRYLRVNLVDYDFRDHRAFIDLKLEVINNGKSIFSKVYSSKGRSQGGKMFWAGAMGMKNAIQQSTMFAVNEIFEKFTAELKK